MVGLPFKKGVGFQLALSTGLFLTLTLPAMYQDHSTGREVLPHLPQVVLLIIRFQSVRSLAPIQEDSWAIAALPPTTRFGIRARILAGIHLCGIFKTRSTPSSINQLNFNHFSNESIDLPAKK